MVPYAMPTYMGASKQGATRQFRTFKTYFKELRSSCQWETLIDRVEHALVAEHYSQFERENKAHGNVKGSLYVFFTEAWFED